MKHFVLKWALVVFSSGALLGTALSYILDFLVISNHFIFFAVIVFAGSFCVFVPKRVQRAWILATIFVFGVFIGGWRVSFDTVDSGFIEEFIGEEVVISGEIVSSPVRKQWNQEAILSIEAIEEENYTENGRAIIKFHFIEEVKLHDYVKLVGRVYKPQPFITDSGREFDYPSYLLNKKIVVIVHDVEFLEIQKGKRGIQKSLTNLKENLIQKIERWVPSPESALSIGMLVGVQGTLGGELDKAFRDTGLSHIVVLSGYNISIVVEGITKTLGAISFSLGVFGGIIGIILFAILVGGGSTVIRASIMASMVILARFLGRPHTAGRGLLYAATSMVLISPRVLLFDLSFQLSFVATLGILYIAPIFEQWTKKQTKGRMLIELFFITLSTQIAVMPLLAYSIGSVSLISLLANIIVLPFVPLAMGLSALLFVFESFGTGFLIAPFTYWVHRAITTIVELLASVPYASIYVPPIGIGVLLVIYAAMIASIIWWWKRNSM
jgi:competence protein ComEC